MEKVDLGDPPCREEITVRCACCLVSGWLAGGREVAFELLSDSRG